MTSLKTVPVIFALGFVLTAAPAIAQGTATPPPATQPPATQPPATPAKPAATTPAPLPPAAFPEGAKIAYVDVQFIASNSAQGKAASARLQDLEKKKTDELQNKGKALEGSRTKAQQGGSVMSQQALAQLQKEIERQERDLQFAQQDAQAEMTELRNTLLEEFQVKLNPILEEVRKEKALLVIFSVADGGIAAADRGLDLSAEVIKRLDAAEKKK